MPSFDLVINNKNYNIETESTDKCRYICKIKLNEQNTDNNITIIILLNPASSGLNNKDNTIKKIVTLISDNIIILNIYPFIAPEIKNLNIELNEFIREFEYNLDVIIRTMILPNVNKIIFAFGQHFQYFKYNLRHKAEELFNKFLDTIKDNIDDNINYYCFNLSNNDKLKKKFYTRLPLHINRKGNNLTLKLLSTEKLKNRIFESI